MTDRPSDTHLLVILDRMTDKGAPISPRMAYAGKSALEKLGYENVEFTDAQKVFAEMIAVSGYSFEELASMTTELLEARATIRRVRNAVGEAGND